MKFFGTARPTQFVRQRSRPKSRIMLAGSIMAWLAIVGSGLFFLLKYENTPGAAANSPTAWPSASSMSLAANGYTLVMLVHPHCPCSRASIGELALLMADARGPVSASVFFLKPDGFSDDWEKTDLWQSAASIPGVKAIVDNGGEEVKRFNAATSGQTLLYDASGELVFSGGITASRGHSGDNAGRSAIEAIVNGETVDNVGTPVFGCPLFNQNSDCRVSKNERSKR